jgi:predicted oxidoreductase
MQNSIEVIVVGAGLAGLVAATEIADAGKRVLILDQGVAKSKRWRSRISRLGRYVPWRCLFSGRNAGRAAAAASV